MNFRYPVFFIKSKNSMKIKIYIPKGDFLFRNHFFRCFLRKVLFELINSKYNFGKMVTTTIDFVVMTTEKA